MRTELPVLELELAKRSVSADSRAAFDAAKAASDHNQTETAWLFLKLADRLQILAADDDELDTRTAALRNEGAEKLSSWRAKTVAELVRQVVDSQRPSPEAASRRKTLLYEATRIRDEGADNTYRRLALVRRNRTLLLPVVVTVVLALIVLVATGISDLDASADQRDAGFLAAVALFGTLGASISAIQSLGDATKQRMPDALTSATMTLTRPVVGTGAALAAVVIAEAGFLKLDTASGYVLLAVSFTAGFSERYIVRLVDTATKRG
jgi:hypothetical protein